MSTINTNVSSLISQHNLAQANADLQVRLQRLSTGLRINRGADDPAGLITSERMRSEIQSIGAAIENGERASNVIATAEAALAEVADLLTSIKGLTIASANTSALSREEIRANQLEVDSAIESISRIANTTSFGGLQLLNGSLDYITSGVATSAITDTRIFAANFGTATVLPVTVEVLNSAQQGALFLSTGAGTIPSATTLEIAGDRGVEVFQFASGTALSAMAFSINRSSDSTGIVATVVAGDGPGLSALRFQTSGFGDEAFVSVQKVPGTGGDFVETYDQIGAGATKVDRDLGQDVVALINGSLALGDGTRARLNTTGLKLELHFSAAFAQTTTPPANMKTFQITGGGANFQLGPQVESSQQVGFGIPSVAAQHLGNSAVGFLSTVASGGPNALVAGSFQEAGAIIDQAVTQVAVLRGRLGAFERNTIETNIRSLQVSLENVSASESRIRDTDFAAEISQLTRAQVLSSIGTSVLGTANSSASGVLSLLQ